MNKIYYLLPYTLKNTSASIAGLFKSMTKYGEDFNTYYNKLLNGSFKVSTEEEINRFLKHASTGSNFYSEFKGRSIEGFPIITKEDIIKAGYSNQIGKAFKVVYSSGTTGTPFKVPLSKEAYQREYAFWWYHRNMAGIEKGDKVATICGHKVTSINVNKPPFWVYNYYENQLIFSSYHLSENNIGYYVYELNKFRPKLIHCYPSSIYLIAKYILDNDIDLDFQPKMIQAVAETTLNYQRRIIEKAFNCKLYVWYGNTEQCGHITECPYGKLHVQNRHSYIRILNYRDEEVKPGQAGRIVATNFNNYCFPLINYDTNDIVTISKDQNCECGQKGLIIDSIDGRIEDYILLPDGRKIGRLDHIFKHTNNIENAQIIQNKIDEVIICINKRNGYSTKDEDTILSEAKSRLGDKINIYLDYDTKIEKETNAKFRFIKQNINLK